MARNLTTFTRQFGGACGLGMRLGSYTDSSDYLRCVNRLWMVLELRNPPSLPSLRIGQKRTKGRSMWVIPAKTWHSLRTRQSNLHWTHQTKITRRKLGTILLAFPMVLSGKRVMALPFKVGSHQDFKRIVHPISADPHTFSLPPVSPIFTTPTLPLATSTPWDLG